MKKCLYVAIACLILTFSVSPVHAATTVFLDNFQNVNPGDNPVPVIGTAGYTGSHAVVDLGGGDKKLRSGSLDTYGFSVQVWPVRYPSQTLTEYDLRIEFVPNASIVNTNAFGQEVILNNGGGSNLFLYWGSDYMLRFWKTVNGANGTTIILPYSWNFNTDYHVTWNVDGNTDRFSLAVNGTTLMDNVDFGGDIFNQWSFSYFSNLATNGSQLIDNVRITDRAAVPEPATMLLFGLGLIGLAGIRKKLN